jgi:hypothetical protein
VDGEIAIGDAEIVVVVNAETIGRSSRREQSRK